MKTNKRRFTKAFVADLPSPPKGKRAYYWDDKARALCLDVTPAGTKAFYVVRKFRGRVERVLIGRFPDTTVAQARMHAGRINGLLDQGINPNEIRRGERNELTLDQLFDVYFERHVRVHNRRPDKAQYNYRTYLKPFHNRRLSEIDREKVQNFHANLGRSKGQRTANIALTLLRALFNRAKDWGLWAGDNPTAGVKRFREKSRDRYLLPNEMGPFLASLRQEPDDTVRDFFLILLLTGVRKSDALTMRWEDVDLEAAIWRIPDTKTGDALTIPLAPEAVRILDARSGRRKGPWVFPSRGRSGHLVEPKTAWRRILERADIEDLWIHDLRRTHGSWMVATGANLPVIGKALGHKQVETTSIYARLDIDPVRRAVGQATAAMLEHENTASPRGRGESGD